LGKIQCISNEVFPFPDEDMNVEQSFIQDKNPSKMRPLIEPRDLIPYGSLKSNAA